MRRLAILTLLLVGTVPGAALSGPHAGVRTIGVAGSVEGISADGGRVAIESHYETAKTVCNRAAVWAPATGKVTRFTAKGQCRDNDGSYDSAVVGLTLAGDRAIWVDYSYGNHAYCNALWTATLAGPKPVDISSSGTCDPESQDGELDFAGHGALLAVASYTFCDVAECIGPNDKEQPSGDYGVVVWRISNGKLVKVLPARDLRRLLAADAGRIAVLEPTGEVVLYDTAGKALRTIAFAKGAVLDAKLSGSDLVVREKGSLAVYDAGSGAARKTLPLASKATLDDVDSGAAVYRLGTAVHLLDLASGHDRVVATVKGLVGAQLEPSGVFYAYNKPGGGAKPGRVVFVPLR